MRRYLPIALVILVALIVISRISSADSTRNTAHAAAEPTPAPRQPAGVSTPTTTATQTRTSTTARRTDCHWRRFRDGAIGTDPGCAPGQLDAGAAGRLGQTICNEAWVAGASRVQPPPNTKDKLLIEYGLPGNPAVYTVAQVIPVEDGGSPSSPRNFYPLALSGYGGQETRAQVAEELHDEICDHKITVTQAARTLEGDWLSRGLPADD